MKFDFAGADDQVIMLSSLLSDMETNIMNLRKLPGELAPVFTGATADGHNAVAQQINQRLSTYAGDVTQLKANIATAAGSNGIVQASDFAGRAMFEGLI